MSPLLRIITVIMSPLLRIITGSGSMLEGCRVHFFQKGILNHLKKVWGRHPSTELMPSRSQSTG